MQTRTEQNNLETLSTMVLGPPKEMTFRPTRKLRQSLVVAPLSSNIENTLARLQADHQTLEAVVNKILLL